MQAITEFDRDAISIRGFSIQRLIEGMTFLDVIPFVLEGRHPDPCVTAMLNGLLVAWVDHGAEPPSTQNVRNVASVMGSFPAACIAGLSTFGSVHVPLERCIKFLQEMEHRSDCEAAQIECVLSWKRIPGLGHPVHDCDPRVAPLLKLAAHNLTDLRHLGALHVAEKVIARMVMDSERPPVANLAGVTAAIWLDLGLPPECVGLIPTIGRAVGWAAHYADQRSLPAFAGSVPPFANP